jgi:hypothetical protein
MLIQNFLAWSNPELELSKVCIFFINWPFFMYQYVNKTTLISPGVMDLDAMHLLRVRNYSLSKHKDVYQKRLEQFIIKTLFARLPPRLLAIEFKSRN